MPENKEDKMPTEKCPHCGGAMEYSLEQEDWVCTRCGYIGVIPEGPLAYVTPASWCH